MTTPAPDAPFRALPDLIAEHARQRPGHPALRADDDALSYAELDALMDRIAAMLQQDGIQPGQCIAICASPSVRYAALFMRIASVVASTTASGSAGSISISGWPPDEAL